MSEISQGEIELARQRFEAVYLNGIGKVRFAGNPWDSVKGRYRDASVQRCWRWFLLGHHAVSQTVRSI